MKKTLVSKEGKSANLTFECTKDEFAKACMEAYEKNKSRYSVDGFRKGKAPKKIIEAKFGKDVFFDEAVNLLIKDEYPKALDEFELDPVDMPKVDFEYIDADKGFKADITVEIMPEVTLKKYKDLEVEKVNTKILKKNVDEAIELERKKNARIQPVDRKAKGTDPLCRHAGARLLLRHDGGAEYADAPRGSPQDHRRVIEDRKSVV